MPASEVEVEEVQYNGWNNSGTFAATGCGFRQVYYCASNQCTGDGVPIRTGGAESPVITAAGGCDPPCSPGYQCEGTACQALCNPLCSPGYHCANDRTCQPDPE